MGTAPSGYGSISESTMVFGETGVSPKPKDAQCGCAWSWDPCLSDSSDCPALLPAHVSSWNGFEAEPVGRGEHTEDWSRAGQSRLVGVG